MPAHGFATGTNVVDITCCFMFVNLDVSILLLYGLWPFGYGYPLPLPTETTASSIRYHYLAKP